MKCGKLIQWLHGCRRFLPASRPHSHDSYPTTSSRHHPYLLRPRLEQLEERTLLSVAYVDDTATGLNNGTSWANAFTSLQSALTAAVSGQTIEVGQGTYKPTPGTDRTVSFKLRNGVSICGGYAGIGAADPDARNVALYPSILSGDIGTVGIPADNCYHVVAGNGTNATAVLDGFTITAGNADGTSSSWLGGGMYNESSSPTLINCTFIANSVGDGGLGGGMYNKSSSPALTNCTFIANSATQGGGMYNVSSSSPTLTNCAFIANFTVGKGVYGSGGGIENSSSSPTLTNCTFSANSADPGGGMYNYLSSPTLTNCVLWGNASTDGGQIYNYNSSSTPVVTYCDVEGGYNGMGNINTDPQFVRNPGPGSDGRWGTADDDYGDLRLRLWSPAADAGKNAAVPAGISTDLAGNPRFAELPTTVDSGVGTPPIVDMGAFEAVAALDVEAGGPYAVLEGRQVTLHASGASDHAGTFLYEWDFNADGQYDDATGPSPVFSAVGMQGPLTLTVGLRLTDSASASVTDSAVLVVAAAAAYVDDTAVGLNNGTSWSNAYSDLQSALAMSAAGQVIRVGQGSYRPTSGTDRTASFVLGSEVKIYGGYAGAGAANPDVRNVALYPSILSGDIGAPGNSADNSYHVVVTSGADVNTVLDGFSISSGNANGDHSSSYDCGGGIFSSAGNPTLVNCAFTGNSSSSVGGGIYNLSSSPTLINCTFTANSVTYHGGGMYNLSSAPMLINCTFAANSAGYYGGGMHNASSFPTLTNCILWGNTAMSGGQISGNNIIPLVTYCDVQGGYTGTGNIDLDPQFVRSPVPGPDSIWGTIDDDYGELRLRPFSLAADAGNNSAVPSGITTDLAVKPRFADVPTVIDTGIGAMPIVDMGAYEAVATLDTEAGGPYVVLEGRQVPLHGYGASAQPGTLLYAWDFDEDGQYDDAVGPTPTFSAAVIRGPRTLTIGLRLTDGIAATVTDTAILGVAATVIYVDDSAAGSNDGTSWANAYTGLQSALAAAIPGQTIELGQGTYKPTTGTDRTVSFQLRNDVSICGGYAGAGTADPDARNVALYPSILSGDIGTVGSMADNSYHVVVGSGTNSTARLDGITITAGNADGDYSESRDEGGGMYNSSGSPTLTNCTFAANVAANTVGYGGGMYNSWSSPILINCTFTANSSSGKDSSLGGGMYNFSSSPTLTNCAFIANSSTRGDTYGGGMYNSMSSPVLTNCTFLANSAGYGGGVYYDYSSSPTLTNCILWGNSATNGSQIYNNASTLVATYNDIQNGYTGIGNINADPQFVRNPAPGVDCKWGTADDDFGDLRLRLTSPCIDAGNNSAIPSGLTTDVTGHPRRDNIPSIVDTGSGTSPLVDLGTCEAVAAVQALAGGPYRVMETGSAVLSGAGYSPNGLPISYAWDFDGDGLYDDATGPSPVFSAAGMQGPLSLPIALRVTDTSGASGSEITVLQVARPLYVDDSATGLNDGTSWANAYTSLQSALAAAIVPQDICVAQGTYKPTADTDRTATFQMKTGVSIYGGYAGTGATEPYARNSTLYASILSGDIGTAGSVADNSYHVVNGSGTKGTAVLDGFTITAGNADGVLSDYSYGGGMYNSGAYYIDISCPTLVNCTFKANSARYGGGMYNVWSSPTLTNCTFIANTATGTDSYGGGMYNSVSSPTLMNCTFTANSSLGTASYGGGMYNSSSSPALTKCAFTANSAANGGGMYNYSSSSPTLNNCTFTANSATTAGGMYNYSSSSPTLNNCTFTANSANNGGGMYNYSSSSPTSNNCTFTANSASASGGGMYNSSSSPKLANCILWANTSSSGGQIYNSGGTPIVTYCDVQGGSSGTGNINVDPQFVRAPNPGRDGKWGTADDDYGDLHLRLISPCIDAGNNAAVPVGVTIDFTGSPRFVDIPARTDTGNGAAPMVDLGAYEAPAAVQAATGGPYAALQGSSIVLAGAGYSPTGLSISYAWDLDGDGQFDDASAASPNFSAVGMPSQTLNIALRVMDSSGAYDTQGTVVRIYSPLYVDDSAMGRNDGTSWANAYTSLQSALAAAVASDKICVAEGTYKPTTDIDRTKSFALKSGVAISGGYAGVGTSDPDTRNPALYLSILSGDIGAAGNIADNSYHVVTGNGSNLTAVLDGFTITAGNANGSGSSNSGGGMYNLSSSPTLVNCTFTVNSASNGGGIYNSSSAPVMTSCSFRANSAGNSGGGMNNASSSPTLTNCTFTANSAVNGGGMYNSSSSSPTLTNCTFTVNSANSGGGMYNSSSAPKVTNCILWANTAPSGGQIYSGTPVVTYCDVQGSYNGTGNINADPQFVRIPGSGPDKKWGTADDDYGDLRLLPASPCIDAGNNAAVPAGVTTDRAGNPRFVDVIAIPDTGSGTLPIVDMGAYESRTLVIAGTDGADDFTLNLTADHASIQIVSPAGTNTYLAAANTSLRFIGETGGNRLTVDFTNGNPVPAGGIAFDAGPVDDPGDCLIVQGTASGESVVMSGNQVTVNGSVISSNNVEFFGFDLGQQPSGNLPGASGLYKTGPGTLVLAGTNSYTGGTTVEGGKIVVANANALPGSSTLVINSGSVVLDTGPDQAVKVNGLRLNLGTRSASTSTAIRTAAAIVPLATEATTTLAASPNDAAKAAGASVPVFGTVAMIAAPQPVSSTGGVSEAVTTAAPAVSPRPAVPLGNARAVRSVKPIAAKIHAGVTKQPARPRWQAVNAVVAPAKFATSTKTAIPQAVPPQKGKVHDAALHAVTVPPAVTDLAWGRVASRVKARPHASHQPLDEILAKDWEW